jgi:hypothetical protein
LELGEVGAGGAFGVVEHSFDPPGKPARRPAFPRLP